MAGVAGTWACLVVDVGEEVGGEVPASRGRAEVEARRAEVYTKTASRKQAGGTFLHEQVRAGDAVSSLAAHLQQLRMPDLHMHAAPDAAALANKAFSRVAANFPFAMGGRGRTFESGDGVRSSSGSRTREGHDVSAQASKVLQKGIGWLLGADDE